jgi:predicted dehydrogenase
MHSDRKVKVGVIGVGRMGSLHLGKLVSLPSAEVVGFYDPIPEKVRQTQLHFHVRSFPNVEELIFEADAVIVASPTSTHYAFAKLALEAGTNVFVEKPVCQSVSEVADLKRIALENKLVFQAGFLERFRLKKLLPSLPVARPRLIECQRLAVAVGREPDIDVISDLMIHDLDLVLSLMHELPSTVEASAVSVVTSLPDIAYVRLAFPSGGVAFLTASRIAEQQERRMRISTEDTFYSLNFLNNAVESFSRDELNEVRHLREEWSSVDPLYEQLRDYLACCLDNREPVVSGSDAHHALQVRDAITSCLAGGTKPLHPLKELTS